MPDPTSLEEYKAARAELADDCVDAVREATEALVRAFRGVAELDGPYECRTELLTHLEQLRGYVEDLQGCINAKD